MYGTQTTASVALLQAVFENDVKMYGTQTITECRFQSDSLRMM